MTQGLDINIKANEDFIAQYNKLQNEYGAYLAGINGFGYSQLSYTDFIENFVDHDTVADASDDGNSNVSHKSVVTLEREMDKPHMKLIGFNKIYYEIEKAFGFYMANKWMQYEWTGKLYMHDSHSATKKPYCFAYDLKDLAEKGLYFIEGRAPYPAKHLEVFVDFVKEFIHYAANLTSGACGLPNLIPYMFYFWKKDVDEDYLGITTTHNEEKYARQNFQRFIFAVNQPFTRDGSQSAFTNTSVFDHPYFEALFGGSVFPDGTFMIDYEDEIINFQKWYMEVMSEIRSECMFTFPVSTISLLKINEDEFADQEFADWAIRHNNKWCDSNLFIDDSVNSLSNCCRLKSNIADLGYFNSIGGTALKVGSVKVNTVNLARIALESNTEDEYIDNLKDTTYVCLVALDRVRHIIKRNVDKHLLPNYTNGLIDFEHQYNTIGFIGVYETMKKFGYIEQDEFGNVYYKDEAYTFGEKIFRTMREIADNFIEKFHCDYHINTEQIPGESAADKLMRKDKFFYGDADIYDLPLYGNQFIPLGIKTTIQERIKIAAKFDKYCNGGSICHVNIDAPFDSIDKAKKLIKYIMKTGLTYFAFNTKIQVCSDNHAFYGTICPKCGKPVTGEYTRIVGFYTKIQTWSKARKQEYKMRKWDMPDEKIYQEYQHKLGLDVDDENPNKIIIELAKTRNSVLDCTQDKE